MLKNLLNNILVQFCSWLVSNYNCQVATITATWSGRPMQIVILYFIDALLLSGSIPASFWLTEMTVHQSPKGSLIMIQMTQKDTFPYWTNWPEINCDYWKLIKYFFCPATFSINRYDPATLSRTWDGWMYGWTDINEMYQWFSLKNPREEAAAFYEEHNHSL